MSVFLSWPGQIVFYTIVAVYIAVNAIIDVISQRHAPRLKTNPSISSKRSTSLGGLALIIVILIALLFGYTGIGLLPDWSYYLGLSLAALGLAIIVWGKLILGRNYSNQLIIYHGHQLVERGPYKFVRHPIYTGGLLAFVGLGLLVQSWTSLIFNLILFALIFSYRIRAEEMVLISEFGEQYQSYAKRVKRLIPFIY